MKKSYKNQILTTAMSINKIITLLQLKSLEFCVPHSSDILLELLTFELRSFDVSVYSVSEELSESELIRKLSLSKGFKPLHVYP